MSDYSLNPIKISAEEFLGAFFQAGERVCIRILPDKLGSAFTGLNLETTQGHFDRLEEELHNHNAKNRGVFYVVNSGGHEDAHIKRITAQFMESDKVPLEEQLARIKAFPLEPSLVVKTRKSLHTYWLIKDGKVSEFRRIQQGLVAHFDADPKCVNESRVFRLPGFNHCKDEPIMVQCVKYNPELRYTQEQLAAVLPDVEAPKLSDATFVPKGGTNLGLKLVGLKCQFIKYCGKNAKTLSEPDWYAMITNLAVFSGGDAAIHKMSKPYPKYSFEQTEAKIAHFHKSKTKPMTCAKISENGFKCPNLQKNACKCKSPAGLAYYPLEMKDIHKRFDSCKRTGVLTEDVAAVRAFIEDYMYNIDTGMVEAFVNSNVKERFAFKTPELRRLVSFHKEKYKHFYNSPQTVQERVGGTELPHWFEVNDRGGLRFMPGVLADHCAANSPVFYCGEEFYFYIDGYYNSKKELNAENFIREHMVTDRHRTSNQIADATHQWKMQIDKDAHEVNPNQYLMNFENGLYNLLTDELLPHDPNVLSTIRLGGKYDPDASCPVFLKYINDALPETEIPLIQEMFGYMLVPVNKAQKAFVMLGKAESGKSTLLYIVQDLLLGRQNCANLEWQSMEKERFAIAQVFGKLANIFADLPNEKIRTTALFKAITGEDYISGQHKFKDFFSFKPFVRLLYSCEEMPKSASDRSAGYYRRLIIMNFSNVVDPAKRDRNLKEKLARETDGILAWSILGLKRLMKNDFCFSETARTRAELQKYKAENSTALTFIYENCVIEPKAEVGRQELFNLYIEYCNDNGMKYHLTQQKFNAELDGLGLARVTTHGVRNWRGIRLS